MTEAQPVPDLTGLLKDSPSNWGKWGEDDEVGSLNYLGVGFQASSTELVARPRLQGGRRLPRAGRQRRKSARAGAGDANPVQDRSVAT